MTRFPSCLVAVIGLTVVVPAARSEDTPASGGVLFFREDWKEIPAATPVTQGHVANPNLVLALHGPAARSVKKSNHPNIPNDPFYIWSGECRDGRWAISLSRQDALVDLSGDASIRVRTFQSGPHVLKFIVELANGQWLVSQQGFGETPDWHVFDQPLSKLQWRELDIASIQAGRRIDAPDLSRVRSIGWTDLTTGNGSDNSTRVDWIEVYGKPVADH